MKVISTSNAKNNLPILNVFVIYALRKLKSILVFVLKYTYLRQKIHVLSKYGVFFHNGAFTFISAMQAQFQAEIDEAPYLAKLNSVLGFSIRFPQGPAQVCSNVHVNFITYLNTCWTSPYLFCISSIFFLFKLVNNKTVKKSFWRI